ncbi:permease [Actibacterium pelagium]|uniref:Transporter n=1 Tax=Actibacterium pelagium TaxID=2029103 RepID=A0A917AF58_9RHOB|nr:permease [Actibacterium pelagium]GGE48227.1 transporter [Actibacterium pelagium]
MAETSLPRPSFKSRLAGIDKVWLVILSIPMVLALVDTPAVAPTLEIAAKAIAQTGIFIVVAISLVAYVKATGAENLLAKAFEGNPAKMVVMAALLGGLSPFCSCEVIPFIAALLAVGAPLAAVMAFWLASPLMDPAMFTITWGEIGLDFAIGKTIAAVGLGMMGGFLTMAFARSAVFVDPLREKPAVGGCCGVKKPFSAKPVWAFWTEGDRREIFRATWLENAVFLFKWLLLAYLFEGLMLRYIPAETISTVLGGEGLGTVILAALVGMPAYLNGYAAVGLVGGLLEQGMSQGAAMAFVLAGGVSCIPAAIAVWALVKPRVFAAYLAFALTGSNVAGMLWTFAS